MPINTHSDPSAERRYLAAIATYNDDLMDLGIERIDPLDFAVSAHQLIATAIYDVEPKHVRRANFQFLVDAHIEDTGYLSGCGGVAKYREIVDDTEIPLSLDWEVAQIKRLAKIRSQEQYIGKALAAIRKHEMDSAEVYIRAAAAISETADNSVDCSAYDAMQDALDQWGSNRTLIAYGIEDIDNDIGGQPPGTMAVIGAGTGIGKSQLALRMALGQAKNGHKPGIVSCEDSRMIWGARLLASVSDITTDMIFHPNRGYSDAVIADVQREISSAVEKNKLLPVHFRFEVGSKITDVLKSVHDLIYKNGCDVIYVDYVQAVRVDLKVSRYDKAVSDIVKQVKGLCHRAKVPLVVVSQLSRRENIYREPTLYDLKESGDIENEAEIVLLLWNTSADYNETKTLCRLAKLKWGQARYLYECQYGQHGLIEDVRRVRK